MMLWQLFLCFMQVGLFSVGGGYAAIPLIQSTVVNGHGWLTLSEFTNLIVIAEMTPGPIAINSATFVGFRLAGVTGALISTLGCVLPSLVIVSVLAKLYMRHRENPWMQSVLGSLRPAVVALIAVAGLNILGNVVFASGAIDISAVSWLGAGLFAAALLILRVKRWNPILVMAGCGVFTLLLSVFNLL